MFVTGRSTFLVTGFLIGCLEAGFIPGSLYYLSTWYKTEEYAVRNTAFYLGNLGASALSGVIASGILSLSGHSGLAGWQWLFMLEGVMTVGIGIVWLFFLPRHQVIVPLCCFRNGRCSTNGKSIFSPLVSLSMMLKSRLVPEFTLLSGMSSTSLAIGESGSTSYSRLSE